MISDFQTYSFTSFRRDRNEKRGGIIFFVRKDIPPKLINFSINNVDINYVCWNQS